MISNAWQDRTIEDFMDLPYNIYIYMYPTISFPILQFISLSPRKLRRHSQDTFGHVHLKPWISTLPPFNLIPSTQYFDLSLGLKTQLQLTFTQTSHSYKYF